MMEHKEKRSFGFLFTFAFPVKRSACISLIIVMWLLLALLNGSHAYADELPYFISLDASEYTSGDLLPVDAVSIFKKRDGYYLFIPSGWDCGRLRILSEEDGKLSLNGKEYQSGDTVSVTPGMEIQINLGENSWTAHVVQSSTIPAVFITTDSRSTSELFSSKENREPGSCKIINSDASAEYDGRLEYIRIRGQYTSTYEKKPFQIKLFKSAPLFGMEKEKKWVLLANFVDKSLIRTTVAMDLARYAGVYTFVPETQPVDLFLNHQYYGSFLLTEKCEIDSDRLDIRDLESITESLNPGEDYPAFGTDEYGPGLNRGILLENDPEDITGGYLVLMTIRSYYRKETSGFITNHWQCFTLKEPENASLKEVEYIQSRFQEIEDALYSDDPNDQTWTEYLDETTFVHRYLQGEITADNDGSVPYFYKDTDIKDPKIYCGPVWDQDNIWGANKERSDPAKLYVAKETWFPVAFHHSEFEKKVRQTYQEVYEPALRILLGEEKDPKRILRSLEEYAEEIAGSAALDNIRWRIVSYRFGNLNQTGDTPEENIAFLHDYISKRKAFLDEQWLNIP